LSSRRPYLLIEDFVIISDAKQGAAYITGSFTQSISVVTLLFHIAFRLMCRLCTSLTTARNDKDKCFGKRLTEEQEIND
jgi:hypothetical protein